MCLDQVPQANFEVEVLRHLDIHEVSLKILSPNSFKFTFDLSPLEGLYSRILIPGCQMELALIWGDVPMVL